MMGEGAESIALEQLAPEALLEQVSARKRAFALQAIADGRWCTKCRWRSWCPSDGKIQFAVELCEQHRPRGGST